MAVVASRRSLLPLLKEGQPDARGWWARRAVAGGGVALLLALPILPIIDSTKANWIAYGIIFVIVGLSINVLMGYAGQVSLGHQAFVGVGAFTSALLVSKASMPFLFGVLGAVATGAGAAVLLGLVALRLKGLYLALITLAYGGVAEQVIFGSPLTGGGAGATAPRPSGFRCPVDPVTGIITDGASFTCEKSFVYLCYAFLGIVLFIDWRLVKSRAGRAIFAIRENEIAAASFGVNVIAYKLMAFVLSGAFAGVAGALFAHWREKVEASQFDFKLALTFVLMAAVGGLGSRIGIFLASMFFAIFPLWFNRLDIYVLIVGPLLLLLTLAQFPGGIGQQLRPLTEWIRGKPFSMKHDESGPQAGGGGVRP